MVPVCFALAGDALYVTIDQKPKRGTPLKRVANIHANPSVAIVVDRYEEDWTQLGWVMLRGPAETLNAGAEHDAAQDMLRRKYPQYLAMQLDDLPVIAIRIAKVASWGALTPEPE